MQEVSLLKILKVAVCQKRVQNSVRAQIMFYQIL